MIYLTPEQRKLFEELEPEYWFCRCVTLTSRMKGLEKEIQKLKTDNDQLESKLRANGL